MRKTLVLERSTPSTWQGVARRSCPQIKPCNLQNPPSRRFKLRRAVAAGVEATMAGALHRSGSARLLFHGRPSTFRRLRLPERPPPMSPPSLLLPFLKQGLSRFSSAPAKSPPPPAKRNGLVSWYLGLLEARPVLTKGATAGFIFTAADVSSQMITLEPGSSYDPVRTLRMATYGALMSGPSLHFWFNAVSKVLPKRDVITTVKKMFIGQTVYGPTMNVVFFSFNARLQGESGEEIIARLKRDLIPTLKSGLAYWPLCDFITFRFVPVHLQPLISNSFSYVWTIYITYMASLKKVDVSEKLTT